MEKVLLLGPARGLSLAAATENVPVLPDPIGQIDIIKKRWFLKHHGSHAINGFIGYNQDPELNLEAN